jgi:hypothetical protein
VPREAIALKAVLEPMLIRDKRIVMQKETRTEFRGMSQPGRTCEAIAISIMLAKCGLGVILSLTYMGKEFGEWEAVITCKGKHLT